MAIFQCNSFTLREYDKLRGKELGSGVFPTIARINHSCVPNTVLSYNLETRECEVINFNLTSCQNYTALCNAQAVRQIYIQRNTWKWMSVWPHEDYHSALSFICVFLGKSKQIYQGRRGDVNGICRSFKHNGWPTEDVEGMRIKIKTTLDFGKLKKTLTLILKHFQILFKEINLNSRLNIISLANVKSALRSQMS